jgi:hypothetical protein
MLKVVFYFHLNSIERKKYRRLWQRLMDKALVCGLGLCGFIYQTVHPKGFGALGDCPKDDRLRLTPVALPLTDQRKWA